MAPLAQERHECLLEVPSPRLRYGRVKGGRRAVEEVLPVREHEQAAAIALRFGEVVRREDDGGSPTRERQDELPETLALTRVQPGAGLVEQQHRGPRQKTDRDVD